MKMSFWTKTKYQFQSYWLVARRMKKLDRAFLIVASLSAIVNLALLITDVSWARASALAWNLFAIVFFLSMVGWYLAYKVVMHAKVELAFEEVEQEAKSAAASVGHYL